MSEHSEDKAAIGAELTAPLPHAGGLLQITDIAGFVAALKETLDPVFEEQRETWEREGPAAEAAFAATGATMRCIGGNCPVQGEGTVDGSAFYFRARGDGWQFHVAPTEDDIFDAPTFYIERDYGDGPFDAGWMPLHEAYAFIVEAIGLLRAREVAA